VAALLKQETDLDLLTLLPQFEPWLRSMVGG
jgi:hypothetical protein